MNESPDHSLIRFAEKVLALLDQGSFTATYKYAVLLGIMDSCMEQVSRSGQAPTSVTTKELAQKTSELYWPHTLRYPITQTVLRQNQGRGDSQAAIVPAIAKFGGGDHTLRLCELATGQCVRTFEGHTTQVRYVSFNPDGRWALSGGGENTLWQWELDWECEFPPPAEWDEGPRPLLDIFLTLHPPRWGGLLRRKLIPSWTKDEFQRLLTEVQYPGHGWLRPEGVRAELEKMTREWKGS